MLSAKCNVAVLPVYSIAVPVLVFFNTNFLYLNLVFAFVPTHVHCCFVRDYMPSCYFVHVVKYRSGNGGRNIWSRVIPSDTTNEPLCGNCRPTFLNLEGLNFLPLSSR